MLGAQRAEERRKWLAPLLGIRAKTLEILLQRQAHCIRLPPCGDNLCHCLDNGIDSTVKRTPRRKIGVEAKRHRRCRIRCAMAHGNLCHHRLRRGQLVLSAERHEDRCRSHRCIKPLPQPLLTAYIQIPQICEPHGLKRASCLAYELRNTLHIRCFLIG